MKGNGTLRQKALFKKKLVFPVILITENLFMDLKEKIDLKRQYLQEMWVIEFLSLLKKNSFPEMFFFYVIAPIISFRKFKLFK